MPIVSRITYHGIAVNADVCQQATWALWPQRVADLTAMQDHINVKLIDVVRRDCALEQVVGGVGADLRADQAETLRDTMNMRVDR